MTPLFPKDNQPITINQGQTGNCYLLSSLDCIFNLDGGRNHIKSLFTENADGSVTLRIKRTKQSKLLKVDKLAGKYTYSLDAAKDEDVFLISKKRLEEIDKDPIGATTNSLAVKILEHISPYYYKGEWEPMDNNFSILAHNIAKRHRESSTAFISDLLGVNYYDSRDLQEILTVKTLYPELPIYISMDWGDADDKGMVHDRHALRIKDFHYTSLTHKRHFKLILVNPWNNQEVTEHSSKNISNYRFCIFSADKALNLIITSKIYQKMPYIFSLYKRLNPAGKELMFDLLNRAKLDKTNFLISFFKNFASFDLLKVVLEQDTKPKDIKAVLIALASEAKNFKQLSTIFETADFFSLIVKTAIKHKTIQDPVEGQQIEYSLKKYYFDNYLNLLTQQAGLRDFFQNKAFSKAHIANYFAPKELLALAIIRTFNKRHNLSINEYLKNADASTVTADFVETIISGIVSINIRSILETLKEIEELNPKLGQELFLHMCNKLNDSSFKPTFNEMIQQIKDEADSPLKKWVLLKQNTSLSEKALIDNCVKLINSLDIQYDDKNTADAVTLHKTRLIDNLNRIVKENHPHSFGFTKPEYPEITLAFNKKNEVISEAAELQKLHIQHEEQVRLQKIIEAKRIMDVFALQLKYYSATFVNEYTSEQVAAHLQWSRSDLQSLFSQTHIVEAYHVLGMTKWPDKLIQLFSQKNRELGDAAKRQNDDLINAKAVIAHYLRLINEFSLDFNSNDDITQDEITYKKEELKIQLGGIIENKSDLIQACKTLGLITKSNEIKELKDKSEIFSVRKPKPDIDVLSAFQAKIQQIDQTAERLKNNIIMQQIIIAQNQQVLDRFKFDTHLAQISEMRDNLGKKTKNYDPSKMDTYKNDSYEKAFGTANALYDALTSAKGKFLRSSETLAFKKSCLDSITQALPVLETHRGWKQFFADILNALLSLVGKADPRLFKTQTNSVRITKDLENVLKTMESPLAPFVSA